MTRYIIGFTLMGDDTKQETKVYGHSIPDAWLKAIAQDTRRKIHSVQDEAFLTPDYEMAPGVNE